MKKKHMTHAHQEEKIFSVKTYVGDESSKPKARQYRGKS